MASLILGISAALSVMAVCFGIVSIMIHYKTRDKPPEVAGLEQRLTALQAEQIDLLDKVETWMKRDRVRNAREKRAEKAQETKEPQTDAFPPPTTKDALRARAAALRIAGATPLYDTWKEEDQ